MIYTGSYKNCKSGNLISISGDRGKKVGFTGKALPAFAPKLSFWKVWESNIGKIDEYENTRYYIEEYYKHVLVNLDILGLLSNEDNPVLLCYEDSSEFCHRHVLAEYIELKYGIKVQEVMIDEKGNKIPLERPSYIRDILLDVIDLEDLQMHGCFNCEHGLSSDEIDDAINSNPEYSKMTYEDAENAIGICELMPYGNPVQEDCQCEYYYPNEECLRYCMRRKNKEDKQ